MLFPDENLGLNQEGIARRQKILTQLKAIASELPSIAGGAANPGRCVCTGIRFLTGTAAILYCLRLQPSI